MTRFARKSTEMLTRQLSGPVQDVVWRLSALALVGAAATGALLLALVVSGVLAVGSTGLAVNTGKRIVRAEFTDVWPLVAHQDVRVSGVVAGTVTGISLTNNSMAMVTMALNRNVPEPRANANASVASADILGDSYVDLELGNSKQLLHGPIPPSRTITEPRLDTVLDMFTPSVRTALQQLIDNMGEAFEGHGLDLNQAILEIRNGLPYYIQLAKAIGSQNTVLSQALTDAEAVTHQAALRSADLDDLIGSLSTTVGTLADHSSAIASIIDRASATIDASRSVLGEVQGTATKVEPLARTLATYAPEFERAANAAIPFAAALREAEPYVGPTVALTGKALKAVRPDVAALAATNLQQFNSLAAIAQQIPYIGKPLQALLDLFGGDAQNPGAVIPGDIPGQTNVDPLRGWAGLLLEPSCELFGVPNGPGCGAKALGNALDYLQLLPTGPTTGSVRRHAAATRPSNLSNLLKYLLGS